MDGFLDVGFGVFLVVCGILDDIEVVLCVLVVGGCICDGCVLCDQWVGVGLGDVVVWCQFCFDWWYFVFGVEDVVEMICVEVEYYFVDECLGVDWCQYQECDVYVDGDGSVD